MVRIIKNISLLSLFCIPILYLSCIDSVNPYDDIGKAKVIIAENSLKDGDTVNVDSTYKLILAVLLQEHIDRFTITINKNASWTDTTFDIDNMKENPITFNIAFYEAGTIEIKITTYFVDNRYFVENIYVYGVSTFGPTITILSGSLQGDTINANTIPFTLKVRIADASNKLDTTLININGVKFDSLKDEDNDQLFYCYATFYGQDFESVPIQARIYAENIVQNSLTETFWICSTDVNTSIRIVRTSPPDVDDSITVHDDSITVYGRVDGIKDSSFYYLFMSVNDFMPYVSNPINISSNIWQRGCNLSASLNRIVFYLYDTNDTVGVPLDSNVLMVNYETAPLQSANESIRRARF